MKMAVECSRDLRPRPPYLLLLVVVREVGSRPPCLRALTHLRVRCYLPVLVVLEVLGLAVEVLGLAVVILREQGRFQWPRWASPIAVGHQGHLPARCRDSASPCQCGCP